MPINFGTFDNLVSQIRTTDQDDQDGVDQIHQAIFWLRDMLVAALDEEEPRYEAVFLLLRAARVLRTNCTEDTLMDRGELFLHRPGRNQ